MSHQFGVVHNKLTSLISTNDVNDYIRSLGRQFQLLHTGGRALAAGFDALHDNPDEENQISQVD